MRKDNEVKDKDEVENEEEYLVVGEDEGENEEYK